jgi:hypothetical protein
MGGARGASQDVVDAAASCAAAMARTTPATLRWWFLEDALVALSEAEDLLADDRSDDAVDALFVALSLLSDAIDATPGVVADDLAHAALDAATRAVAAVAGI